MDGDEVRDLQQLIHRHAFGGFLVEDVLGEVGIVGHHVHLEGVGQLGHALAHTAKAQNAQSLAPQLPAHKLVLVPVFANLNVVAGVDGVAGDIQHLGDGQLGHSVVVEAGGVEDLDALLCGGVHVDMVQAHGAHADDLQLFGGVQDFLVDGGVYAHDEDLIVADHAGQLLLSGENLGIHLHIFAQFLSDCGGDDIDDKTFHKPTFLPVLMYFRARPWSIASLLIIMPYFLYFGKYLFVEGCYNCLTVV